LRYVFCRSYKGARVRASAQLQSLRVLSRFVLAINVAEKERKFFSNLDQNWGVQTPLCAVCMFSLPIDNKGKWEQNCTIGIKLMNLVPL
jgi:hypothetical protein